MIDMMKLHITIKKLFKEVEDIDKVMIFAYKENNNWKIAFSKNGSDMYIPKECISLFTEFKSGFLNHSPSLATKEIYDKLKNQD